MNKKPSQPKLSRFPLPYSTQSLDDDDLEAVRQALRSEYLTQGPLVEKFEQALARRVGAKFAVTVSSGSAALHLACLALELPAGFRAAVPAVSFVATANCVVAAGGRPEFIDVEPETGNISLASLERSLSSRKKTHLILPVHLSGYPCEMSHIARLAKEGGAKIIEDATHALGVNHLLARGRGKAHPIGSCRYADCAVFSFHAVKPITTGEGGAITTNSRRLYERLLRLRTHGITRERRLMARDEGPWFYEMQELGFNYRLTDFQCALGLSQLRKLDRLTRRRREIARRYTARFSGHRAFACPPPEQVEVSSNHLYVVRLNLEQLSVSRRELFERLREKGLGVNVHYIPIVNQPYYRAHFHTRPEAFPGAQDYYQRAISLPLFPELTRADEGYVMDVVDNVLGQSLTS
jgi:perosamine synthetase